MSGAIIADFGALLPSKEVLPSFSVNSALARFVRASNGNDQFSSSDRNGAGAKWRRRDNERLFQDRCARFGPGHKRLLQLWPADEAVVAPTPGQPFVNVEEYASASTTDTGYRVRNPELSVIAP